MGIGENRAEECWEVEQKACGGVMRPYCMVILKNKEDDNKTVVQATSSDFVSMDNFAGDLRKDLQELTNVEFVNKYDIKSAV